jgi:hypothetical protein
VCLSLVLQTSIVKNTKVLILIHFNFSWQWNRNWSVDMTTYVANRLATKNEIVKILGRGKSKIKSNCSQIYCYCKSCYWSCWRRSCNNVIFQFMKKFIESVFGKSRN